MSEFSFQLHNTMHAGIGWSRKIGEFVHSLGWEEIAIFVDAGVSRSEYFAEIKPQIDGIYYFTKSGEPTYDQLDVYAHDIRRLDRLDGIIGLGGGSTMDVAKAVAALRTNWMPAIHYRGFDKLTKPGVPVICIPTTAGTGSEVTPNAVFIDTKEKRKLGINGRYVAAQYAILDAEWLVSCPRDAAVSAGMDALVHGVEGAFCIKSNQVSRLLSYSGFGRVFQNLGDSIEQQQDRLLGAYLAAAGLFNSGSGIAGAISYPLGVHFGVPHGIAGGMFIADVIELNVPSDELVWGLFVKLPLFKHHIAEFGCPQYLTQWGLRRRDLDRIMDLIAPVEPAFAQNPVPFTLADAREMINKHLED